MIGIGLIKNDSPIMSIFQNLVNKSGSKYFSKMNYYHCWYPTLFRNREFVLNEIFASKIAIFISSKAHPHSFCSLHATLLFPV